jgi:transposase
MRVVKKLRRERRTTDHPSQHPFVFVCRRRFSTMHFVGIDWADQTHDICILAEDGEIISQFKIDHTLDGFHQLDRVLHALRPLRISIERPDGLLVDYLIEHGWELYLIPPRATAAKRGRRSKNDKQDALLLANLLRTADREVRPINRPSALAQHLKHRVRLLDKLMADRTRYANRLVYTLKLYHPTMLGTFRYIYAPLTLAFLQRFPDPQTARDASLTDFETFFEGRHYNSKHKIPGFHARFQEPVAQADDVAGHRFTMLSHVTMLETLNNQILPLQKDIKKLFDQHPEADWWSHFPGVGDLTGPRLLAYIGDNRARFPNYAILQANAGTVPITEQSGQRSKVLFRKECSKPLRNTVTQWAKNSLRQSAWAKAYFANQRSRGHDTNRAYRALANSWVRIFWTLWQSGEYYDAERHERDSILLRDRAA